MNESPISSITALWEQRRAISSGPAMRSIRSSCSSGHFGPDRMTERASTTCGSCPRPIFSQRERPECSCGCSPSVGADTSSGTWAEYRAGDARLADQIDSRAIARTAMACRLRRAPSRPSANRHKPCTRCKLRTTRRPTCMSDLSRVYAETSTRAAMSWPTVTRDWRPSMPKRSPATSVCTTSTTRPSIVRTAERVVRGPATDRVAQLDRDLRGDLSASRCDRVVAELAADRAVCGRSAGASEGCPTADCRVVIRSPEAVKSIDSVGPRRYGASDDRAGSAPRAPLLVIPSMVLMRARSSRTANHSDGGLGVGSRGQPRVSTGRALRTAAAGLVLPPERTGSVVLHRLRPEPLRCVPRRSEALLRHTLVPLPASGLPGPVVRTSGRLHRLSRAADGGHRGLPLHAGPPVVEHGHAVACRRGHFVQSTAAASAVQRLLRCRLRADGHRDHHVAGVVAVEPGGRSSGRRGDGAGGRGETP